MSAKPAAMDDVTKENINVNVGYRNRKKKWGMRY
jgi:hypothetical protein